LGYKRKDNNPHLYQTAATRAKIYRSGNTTFVAVGFDYTAGGSHAHLVEKGHAIVTGGTLSKRGPVMPGITASGKRWLRSFGLEQGNWETDEVVLHGKRKGKPRIAKGGWKYTGAKAWKRLGMQPGGIYHIGMSLAGRRVRGGGRLLGGRTSPKPMLGPAFDLMARPMLITIENELRKVGAKAEELAQNVHKPTDSITAAGWAKRL